MDAPKRTALKMTTGYESNWYGVVTSEHDDDPTTVEYILATEHARIVAEKDARIAELEVVLKTARRDAFEEAAKVADNMRDEALTSPSMQHGRRIAAALRALAEKG